MMCFHLCLLSCHLVNQSVAVINHGGCSPCDHCRASAHLTSFNHCRAQRNTRVYSHCSHMCLFNFSKVFPLTISSGKCGWDDHALKTVLLAQHFNCVQGSSLQASQLVLHWVSRQHHCHCDIRSCDKKENQQLLIKSVTLYEKLLGFLYSLLEDS